MSWSSWLQSFKGNLTGIKDTSDLDGDKKITYHGSPSSSHNQSLSKLYPEEGISEEIATEVDGNFNYQAAGNSSPNYTPPTQYTHNFMSRGQSGLSSTPVYAGHSSMNEILSDPLLSQPSTSVDYISHVSPAREDSLTLLKKSFHDSDPIYQPSTSNMVYPTTRKRLRETTDRGNDYSEYQPSSTTEVKATSMRTSLYKLTDDSDSSVQEQERSKRPRFSVSAFGSPIFNKTLEKASNEPPFSLFYPGKIMFGGASNHQVKRCRVIPKKITPKPVTKRQSTSVDESSDGGLSLAAKRILSCIDKISTPLSASKHISLNNSRDFSFHSSPFEADFHKNRPVLKSKINTTPLPPTNKLLTPSKALTHVAASGFVAQNSRSFLSSSPRDRNEPSDSLSNEGSSKDIDVSTKSVDVASNLNKAPNEDGGIGNITSSSSNSPDKLCSQKMPEKETKTTKDIIMPSNSKIPSSSNPPVSASCAMKFTFSNPNILSTKSSSSNIPVSSMKFKFRDALRVDSSVSSNIVGNWPDKFKLGENNWECDVCLLQNSGCDKCVACEAPKPKSGESEPDNNAAITTSSSIDPFNAQKSYWECDVCLVQNKLDAVSCVACTNPNIKSKESISHSPKPQLNMVNSWGDAFKRKTNTWDCQVCLVQNDSAHNKCVACETDKPISSSLSSQKSNLPSFGIPSQTNSNGFGDKFKPTKGSWDCSVCLIQNDEQLTKCIACETPKPNDLSAKKSSSVAVGNLNVSSPVDATFPEPNKICPSAKLDTILCNKENSGIDPNKLSPGKMFKDSGKEIMWECNTCLVRNNASLKRCVCCDAPKLPADPSSIVSAALTGNFKFGVNTKSIGQTVLLPAFSSTNVNNNFNLNTKEVTSVTQPSSSLSSVSFSSLKSTNQPPTVAPVSLTFSFNTKTVSNSLSTSTVASSSVISFPSVTFTSKPSSNNLPVISSVNSVSSTSSDTKPSFQFSNSNLTSNLSSSQKPPLEFPKFDKIPSSVGIVAPTGTIKDDSTAKVNPLTFNFFDKSSSVSSAPIAVSSNSTENPKPLFSEPKSNSVFSFGQSNNNNNNNVATGFSFGQSLSKPPSFNFGSSAAAAASPPLFQFGQKANSSSTMQFKTVEPPAPAAFMSMEAPKGNNPFSTTTVGGQRRIIKRAIRRSNKP